MTTNFKSLNENTTVKEILNTRDYKTFKDRPINEHGYVIEDVSSIMFSQIQSTLWLDDFNNMVVKNDPEAYAIRDARNEALEAFNILKEKCEILSGLLINR